MTDLLENPALYQPQADETFGDAYVRFAGGEQLPPLRPSSMSSLSQRIGRLCHALVELGSEDHLGLTVPYVMDIAHSLQSQTTRLERPAKPGEDVDERFTDRRQLADIQNIWRLVQTRKSPQSDEVVKASVHRASIKRLQASYTLKRMQLLGAKAYPLDSLKGYNAEDTVRALLTRPNFDDGIEPNIVVPALPHQERSGIQAYNYDLLLLRRTSPGNSHAARIQVKTSCQAVGPHADRLFRRFHDSYNPNIRIISACCDLRLLPEGTDTANPSAPSDFAEVRRLLLREADGQATGKELYRLDSLQANLKRSIIYDRQRLGTHEF